MSRAHTHASTCWAVGLHSCVNHECFLPALAVLTPIHSYLAVQYQMCVVAQLPHVLLMTTTLWQGVVTVLSMCVFRSLEGGQRIDWAESRYSLRSAPRSAMRTNRTYAVAASAHAETLRKSSISHSAVQRMSPNWPFEARGLNNRVAVRSCGKRCSI